MKCMQLERTEKCFRLNSINYKVKMHSLISNVGNFLLDEIAIYIKGTIVMLKFGLMNSKVTILISCFCDSTKIQS